MYPQFSFSLVGFQKCPRSCESWGEGGFNSGELKWKETDVVLILAANVSPKNFAKTCEQDHGGTHVSEK